MMMIMMMLMMGIMVLIAVGIIAGLQNAKGIIDNLIRHPDEHDRKRKRVGGDSLDSGGHVLIDEVGWDDEAWEDDSDWLYMEKPKRRKTLTELLGEIESEERLT